MFDAAHFVSYKLYFDRSTDLQSELLLLPLPPAVFHKQLFGEHCIEPCIFLLLPLSTLSNNFQRALLTQHTGYGISPSTCHLQLDVEAEPA